MSGIWISTVEVNLTWNPLIPFSFRANVESHREIIRELEEVYGGQTPTAQLVSRDDAVRHRALVQINLVNLKLEKETLSGDQNKTDHQIIWILDFYFWGI